MYVYLITNAASTLPYIVIGVIGLVLAGRAAPGSRALALCGSALAIVYGLVWFVLLTVLSDLLQVSVAPLVWEIADYGSLVALLGSLVLLGIAAIRRGAPRAGPPPAMPGGGPPTGPPAPGPPPPPGPHYRPPYADGA